MIKNKRILITGGAGFIGSAISQRLAKKNNILIFDNLRRNAIKYFYKKENPNINIEVVNGDILDPSLLRGIISYFKPNIILHLAAMAGVSDYYKQPVKTMEVNAVGTYNVLTAAKELALDRFVYFSTSEVYGPLVFGAKEEGNTAQGDIKQIRWSYGISKLAGEAFAFAFAQEYKIPIVSIRPFNIYGPGQVGEGAVQIFVRHAIESKTIEVTGDGNQIRAWCYIDDFCDGLISATERNQARGEIFNLGNPEGTITILSLARLIASLANSKSKIAMVPHKGVDIDLRVPNIKKAEEILDYHPKVSLEEGIKRSIKWYKETKLTEPLQ